MPKHRLSGLLLLFFSALVVGCGSATPQAVAKQEQQAATLSPSPTVIPTKPQPLVSLTEQQLQNAQYQLPDLGAFQLKDGKYENQYGSGATQVNRVDLVTAALGDLNGDGARDAAVTLAWNSGGSGTFIFLVALLAESNVPKQAAAELLGDRVVMKKLSIENEQIVIEMQGFAAGDPQCCPSQGMTRTYKLDGNKLALVGELKVTRTVTPAPSPVASLQSRFDPQKHECSNPPVLVLTDQVWQTYAAPIDGKGGDPLKAGQPLTLNLRNKLGPATDKFDVTVGVVAPGGSFASAKLPLNGNDWAVATYPKGFSGAQPTVPGVYTVLWQVPAGVFRCDGFVVTGG